MTSGVACVFSSLLFFCRQLDIRTDSAELKESLASLSTFYTHKNTVESRRQLRSELEAEGLRIARDFIGEFSDLEAVGSTGYPPSATCLIPTCMAKCGMEVRVLCLGG